MILTTRQRQILQKMADTDEELVYERGEAWVGYDKTSARTVFALLRLCAISKDDTCSEKMEVYTINETGRELLEGKISPELLNLRRKLAAQKGEQSNG
jgi:hypothetical protein